VLSEQLSFAKCHDLQAAAFTNKAYSYLVFIYRHLRLIISDYYVIHCTYLSACVTTKCVH